MRPKIRATQTLLTALLPAAFLAAGFVLAPSMAQAQAGSLSEDFNTNALPGALEESGPSPNYAGGTVIFPNWDRRYLRTIANYNNTNFIAEVTVTVSSGSGGNGMGFFGLGSGTAKSDFFAEPRVSPTTYDMHASRRTTLGTDSWRLRQPPQKTSARFPAPPVMAPIGCESPGIT